MDTVLPISLLVGASMALLYISHTKRHESFEDIIDPTIQNTFTNTHTEFVRQSAEKYNPLMNLINTQRNPLVKPNYTPNDAANATKNVRKAFRTASSSAEDPSFKLSVSDTSNILINRNSIGSARQAIINSETVKSINCSAFDNSDFAQTSGICHEEGIDSGGNPMVGGLYVSEDDKETAKIRASRMNSKEVNYYPTVGKCKPYRFSTTKQQCLDIQNEMNCVMKQSFDVDGCAMCFQDDTFHYIDPDTEYTTPSFQVVGSGVLVVTPGSSGTTPTTITLTSTPQTIDMASLKEGDVIQFKVSPAADSTSTTSVSLSGFLIGQTNGGDFRIDIIRLIQSDTISGTKPRVSGTIAMNNDNYTVIRPARGQTIMNLPVLNTFSFLDVSEYPAEKCGSAPYVKSAANLNILNSSPCYKKGQKPGAYSLECLQQTFESAGCTSEGTAYPGTEAAGKSLMTGKDGSLLSIGEIANLVYTNSILAYTGKKSDGTPLSIPDWNTYAQFCTGKTITSPCDTMQSGDPISTDCLNYLWQNAGVNTKSVGSTYLNPSSTSSLDSQNNDRYCTPNGTMAPIDTKGQQNQEAITTARSKGSVASVKSFYDSINKQANNNSLTDTTRKTAVKQCYGINFAKFIPDILKIWNLGPNSDVSLPSSFVKSGGQDEVLDAYVYTITASTGNIDLQVRSKSGRSFIGFTENPNNPGFDQHEYILYPSDIEKQVNIYEKGVNNSLPLYISATGLNLPASTLRITYDGSKVQYYLNSTLLKTTTRTSKNPLYCIILLKNTRSAVEVIKLIRS